jgi:hypothetical protein
MRASGEGAPPDRRFEALRKNLELLRQQLAEFEGHPGTRLARGSNQLSGNSRDQWQEQESAVAHAARCHKDGVRRLEQVPPASSWPPELATTLDDVRSASVALQEALHVAARVARVRGDYGHRLRVVRDNAARAADRSIAGRAEELIDELDAADLERSPDGLEAEVERLEHDGFRRGVDEGRVLIARLREAVERVRHVQARVARFRPPLPDLDELEDQLDRIEEVHRRPLASESSAGELLGRWQVRAGAAEAAVMDAVRVGDDLRLVRDRLRGQTRALAERAGRLGRLERRDVNDLLVELREGLRTGPSDLELAEQRVLDLANLLGEPPSEEEG